MLPELSKRNLSIFASLSREFDLIREFYGDKRAERSQVPLINHIIEGVDILDFIEAELVVKAAFCIHPLVQGDAELADNFDYLRKVVAADVLGLAMEYRSVANEYLSKRVISDISEIRLSPLPEVNQMLIADKVQNYKDFLIYHHGTHPRNTELVTYFNNWLARLACVPVMDFYFPEWRKW